MLLLIIKEQKLNFDEFRTPENKIKDMLRFHLH
jgi:hypothetical protein